MVTNMSESGDVFDDQAGPSPVGSTEFSLDLWESIRDSGISPTTSSGYSNDIDKRREFLVGARLYGMELVAPEHEAAFKKANPKLKTIKPQQLQMVDTINLPHDEYAVEIPRRGSKTTTIFCILLGRCAERDDYYVTFSAQTGKAGTRRLREWKKQLDTINPEVEKPRYARASKPAPQRFALFGIDDPTEPEPVVDRGFRILMGEVGKGIYFDNGSQFLVFAPDAGDYRGDAADVSWIDEAQEIDPEAGEELLAGIAPLQDTREDAAVIISGTAGEARAGIFWEALERGRAGHSGIIDFAAPDDVDWELLKDEDHAIAVLKTMHPGIGTLTTEAKMRGNYRKLPLPKWAREYLSLWPIAFGRAAIDFEKWKDGNLEKFPARPARVAFGRAVHPGGSVAAICVAWRNSRGVAFVELVEHKPGTDWVPKREQELTVKYRGAFIAYDDIGEGKASTTEGQRLRPKPRMRMITYRENAAGCVQILRDIDKGKLKHPEHKDFDDVIGRAAKREIKGEQGVWVWGITASGGDITVLVAATLALRNWDQYYATKSQASAGPYMGK